MIIMHFLVTNIFSGAENVALSILSALKKNHTVYYVSPDGPIRSFVESSGVNFIAADTDNISVIKKICKEYKPDIVHAHDPRMSFKCAAAGVKFISYLHSNCPWMRKPSLNSLALLYMCKKAEKVICVSESICDEYIFAERVCDKVAVIPNAVDSKAVLSKSAEEFTEKYDMVFVGRLSSEKNPKAFIDLVCSVSERLPDIKAAFVGDGELLEELKAYASEMSADIAFLGFQENPYKIMKNCRVFISTSIYEGFGLAAVESLILGVPVLCFGVGGLVKIVNDSNGKICSDIYDMSFEAYRLLCDDEYYGRKSAGALKFAEVFTDMDIYLKKITDIYGLDE